MTYRVKICVREVKGYCSMGYKPGDCLLIERYYIRDVPARTSLNAHATLAIPQECASTGSRYRQRIRRRVCAVPRPRGALHSDSIAVLEFERKVKR